MKRGSSADLLVLADSLDRVNASGALAKSGRSDALASGDEPSSFKAESIELIPDMPAAEAFQVVARACVQQFRLNEPLLIARQSAEPLHQARVAMRRLRSALSLFKPIVADPKYEGFKRGLRDLSHKLGEARDLDVFIARSTVLNASESGSLPPLALERVGRVQAERDQTYQHVISELKSKRFRLLMQNFVIWIEAGPWCTWEEPKKHAARDQTILDFAAHVLDRRWRKLEHGGRYLDRLSSEQRHRIRMMPRNCGTRRSSYQVLWLIQGTVSDIGCSSLRSNLYKPVWATSMTFRRSAESRPGWHVLKLQPLRNSMRCAPRQVISVSRRSA